MKHLNELNFLSIFLASPEIKLGNINYNTKLILSEIAKNSDTTNLFVFPELCITGASLGNYFLLESSTKLINNAIFDIIVCSYSFHTSIILGTPLQINGRLINCALFISDGKLIGIVPKNSKQRYFNKINIDSFTFNGYDVPISTDLIFHGKYKLGIVVGAPTINRLNSLHEADIVAIIDASPYNLNKNIASDINVFSKYTNQAILYVNTSENESSTDNLYHSETILSECGALIYGKNEQIYMQDLVNDSTFIDNNKTSLDCNNTLKFNTKYLKTEVDLDIICNSKRQSFSSNTYNNIKLIRFDFIIKNFNSINRYKHDNTSIYADPFKTNDIQQNIYIANKILEIQALSLARRIKDINITSLVLGISGGIDSTLALLVAIRSFEILGFDKQKIYAITMPGPGTSDLTNDIAEKLCLDLKVNYSVIPITDSINQHFNDIQHDSSEINVVFENSQARMRTMILFNYANKVNGIVIGTGDMSEIALGWSTFNGDHISNYNVNCGIPKTVAIAMLRSFAKYGSYTATTKEQIERILQRPISPELIPITNTSKVQSTEKIIGNYTLNDFFMYYFLKYYLSKSKIICLANIVFKDIYNETEIEQTFDIFWTRFVQNQHKRSCAADGPAVFDISLSPRNGAIFPSDIGTIEN